MSISEEARAVTQGYAGKEITIGMLGSHSAKQIASSAKRWNFKTVVVAEKGRDSLYSKRYRFLFDEVIIVDHFRDILTEGVQKKLREMNTVFIPNRSFSFYVGYQGIETEFLVPMLCNRYMLKTEERSDERGQFYLLEKARIKTPKRFSSPEEIDRLVVVKLQQAKNPAERANFLAVSAQDFREEAKKRLRSGLVDESGLEKATIEEFVIGAEFNADFHNFVLNEDFDLVGFSNRIQANLQGVLKLPAKVQLKLNIAIKVIEAGHFGVTMRESLQEMIFDAAERMINVCKNEYPPGMIGLFSLQGAIAQNETTGKLEFIVFDFSPRVPGDPCIGPTSPEMPILSQKHGTEIIDPLDLSMMEIRQAIKTGRIAEIVT